MFCYFLDRDLISYVWDLNKQLEERSKTKDTSGGNLNGTEIQSTTSKNENAIESNLDSQVIFNPYPSLGIKHMSQLIYIFMIYM
jgi:hypothetical protein